MGNSVQPTARPDGDNGAGANWSHFPRGTKELFYQYYSRLHSLDTFRSQSARHDPQSKSEVVFSSPGTVRDGLDLVVNFVILSSQLFANDRTYDWNNLNQTLKAAYILTAEFLLKNKRGGGKTMLLLVYAGFLEECISRGFDAVCGSWIVVYNGGAIKITRLKEEHLFKDLAHLHRAVMVTKSTHQMAFFLCGKLAKYTSKRLTRRLIHMLNEQLPSTPLHTFDTGVACPAALLKLKIVYSDGPAFVIEMDIYNDTLLACVFRNCMSLARGDSNELFNAKLFPELCLWSLRTKHIFYLSSDSNKTVGELGIKDGDAFQVLRDPQDVSRFSVSSTIKGKDHRSIRFPSLSLLACGSVYP